MGAHLGYEITARVGEVDGQMDRVRRLIDSAARIDPELASGLATGEAMTSVQKKIDQAATSSEQLATEIIELSRQKARQL